MLNTFKRDFKKLYQSYRKQFKLINKNSISGNFSPESYFVTHLSFIRDILILTKRSGATIDTSDTTIMPLVCALHEYEQFQTCIHDYYRIEAGSGCPVHREEFTAEAAAMQYQERRTTHWDNFWELVKLSIEDWRLDA